MIYFIILSLVCLFAVWRGSKESRFFGYCVLAVFFADRVFLATFDIRDEIVLPLTTSEANMMVAVAFAEFAAILAIVFSQIRTVAAGGMVCLFMLKMFCYVGLVSAIIDFTTTASWAELFGYCQIAVVGGGTLGGVRGKRSGHSDNLPHRIGIFSLVKGRFSSRERP